MPVDNNQKGVKNVQTLLAPKKPGAIDKDSAKEKPPKQNKRSHSDVANESVEGVDMIGIQSDLSEIKQSLRGTVTKSDLKGAMDNLVQQKDLKGLVTDIVQKLLTNFEEKITKKIEHVIWERTGKLQDQLDSLMIENENIRERIRAKDKIIESLEERVQDNTNRSIEVLKLLLETVFSRYSMDGLHITGLYFYFQFSLNQINELISQHFTFFLWIVNHSNVVFSSILFM
jgi:hypothetical protein